VNIHRAPDKGRGQLIMLGNALAILLLLTEKKTFDDYLCRIAQFVLEFGLHSNGIARRPEVYAGSLF
jgi:hypothetical protein